MEYGYWSGQGAKGGWKSIETLENTHSLLKKTKDRNPNGGPGKHQFYITQVGLEYLVQMRIK
eukprot:CAMPEP_0180184532 /NCGR_PEP_ID=MMETSP0986-20121125/41879_1 /TAXON_ID=697907 /ORGANISM="non described non described, Strain CCMP2293" /LENGTH=61 /DNA_ID=CAMNT_0022138233 /DNA_START=39 /DNA_END=221 /DNA_ORIENTATION=-